MEAWDVVVVGAGIAGLAAAESLGRAGVRTLVLEARDRLGGRIFSLPGLVPEHAIELGAEFVHGRPPLFDEYLAGRHLSLRETRGTEYCSENDIVQPCGGGDGLLDHIGRLNPKEVGTESFDRTLQTRFAKAADDDKQWARWFVQGFHAADPARIGTQSVIADARAEQETEGDRAFHVVGGYHRVIEALRHDLDSTVSVETDRVVQSVNWGGAKIAVTALTPQGERVTYSAENLVVTLPLGVLQQGTVRFEPPLEEKRRACSRLAMGPATRVVLEFRSAFWEDEPFMHGRPLRQMHFLFTRDPGFPTFWTAMPLRVPVLVAWAAGPLADAKRGQSHEQVEAEALASLARIFALSGQAVRREFVRSFFHDWQADPFSCGAYSYGLAGGTGAQQELASPLRNRLFFAGEATQGDGHHATVHGAYDSGRRAAREVLDATK